MERSFGNVKRSLRLPKNADIDNVKVSYDYGVLNVKFSKKEGLPLGRKLQIL